MLIRFLFILLCLCATNALAKFEVIVPASIGDSDQYDSTGSGATKTIRITDGTDGNYIFSATAGLVDRYNLGDLTSTDVDEVDSVVVYWTGQDNGNGNNRIVMSIRINTDETSGSSTSLTTSWVEYSTSFGEGPNSRVWTQERIDSLVVVFDNTAIGSSREVRVTECSVVVWYKSLSRTLMFPAKDDACLSGTDYDHDLLRKSAMQNDTAFNRIDAGENNHFDYWKTGNATTTYHKMNNDDWETGGFGIFLDVVHVKGDCSLKVVIQRYNSSCALQESTPEYPASGAQILVDTTGHYEIQIPQHNWSSGACGDEIAIRFEWTNALFEGEDSTWIRYGSPETYFEHEIVINQSPCPAGTGAGDCAIAEGQDTVGTVPAQEGGIANWANQGGADLITSISDAVDANYMFEVTPDDSQEVQFAALSEPGDLATYDSVTIVFRAQRNLANKPARMRVRLQDSTAATTQFCTSGNISITSLSWTDYDNHFTVFGAPNDSNSCEGSLSTAEINTWEVIFIATALGGSREIQVTSVDLVVCYTKAGEGGEQNFRRIRLIKLGKLDDKTVWDTYFAQTLEVEDGYEISTTFGVGKGRWLWE